MACSYVEARKITKSFPKEPKRSLGRDIIREVLGSKYEALNLTELNCSARAYHNGVKWGNT